MEKFRIERHSGVDKSFSISNDEIRMMVDYDQVKHATVDKLARKIVTVLNEKIVGTKKDPPDSRLQ
jgi:hypothetical protein